jgi:hypothetical protein
MEVAYGGTFWDFFGAVLLAILELFLYFMQRSWPSF